MDLSPGTVLLGKYRVEELIGTGGMARVVRVAHLYLQQSVALKVLLPNMVENQDIVQRFLREAQATVKLRSEHIARVSDVGTLPDGAPFMEMEFLDGNDLNQILRHHGPQLPAIVVDLMLQACEGLAEAHYAGIVHRDVKPSNFFITRRPDGSMLLKILDFGISKTPIDGNEATGSQQVIGTPTYMAPEQMKSGRAADPRSDIWSLGVVMYQLINGRPPFSGESYAELVYKVGSEPPLPMHVQIDQGLHDVIFRCLEKDPSRRWANVAELSRQLAPYASDPAAGAQSASRIARILLGSRQHNQAVALSAAGGLQPSAQPQPLSAASWKAQSGPSSLARGQMTYMVTGRQPATGLRGKKGLWVAGIAGIVLGTTVGAIAFSGSGGGGDKPKEPAVATPAPKADPAPTPAPPAQPAVAATPPATVGSGSNAPTAGAGSAEGSSAPTIAATPPPTVPTVPATVDTKPADTKPADAKPAVAVTAPEPPKPPPVKVAPPPAKPAVVAAKPTPKPAPPPTQRPAVVVAKPTPPPAKPATPPAKPANKPKPHANDDDLFNSRK